MSALTQPEVWIALLTLTALEIVLGIDNIVFISILSGKLPPAQRNRGRLVGLGAAMITRILLLLSLAWVIGLTHPFLTVLGFEFAGRDVILIGGGLFLLTKSTQEIHDKLEGEAGSRDTAAAPSFAGVIVQIALLDIVFSLDSVITAVGMARDLWVMVTAIVVAVGIMMAASGSISRFVEDHPTVKMLALSFLLLIGMSLVAEGMGLHIPKAYIYFAMGFSVFVEAMNLRLRGRGEKPVRLREPFVRDEA